MARAFIAVELRREAEEAERRAKALGGRDATHGANVRTSGAYGQLTAPLTLARLAAGEAIIGLLIEITFIATFTRRFFAR